MKKMTEDEIDRMCMRWCAYAITGGILMLLFDWWWFTR
jgi:hypothetical protein